MANEGEREYLVHLADRLSRLSDLALSQLAPFDQRYLHELPAPGCRRSARRPYEECVRERSSIWSSGRLICYQEPPVSIMNAQTKALWPSIPNELADIMPLFRVRVGAPMTVRTYGALMARSPLTPTLHESNPAA